MSCTYFYLAPIISWDARLRTTKVKLELLSSHFAVLLFFGKSIRGGRQFVEEKRDKKASN